MGSFPYGNPFEFCKAWRASYFLIYTIRKWQANTDQYRQLVITLHLSPRHLMKASNLWRRQPLGSPLRLPIANDECYGSWRTWKLPSASIVAVAHVVKVKRRSTYFYPTSVAPYSIISSILNWRICEILSNYLFGPREAGKSLVNSLSQDAFNAQNTCHPFVGPDSDEGVASSTARFSFLYIECRFLIFLHFILGWLLRETERDRRLSLRRLSFRRFIFRHLIFRQSSGLSSE